MTYINFFYSISYILLNTIVTVPLSSPTNELVSAPSTEIPGLVIGGHRREHQFRKDNHMNDIYSCIEGVVWWHP